MNERSKLGEDVDGLRRSRELEKERLQQNDCDDDSARPAEYQDWSRHGPAYR
jgi:hypothetical protein